MKNSADLNELTGRQGGRYMDVGGELSINVKPGSRAVWWIIYNDPKHKMKNTETIKCKAGTWLLTASREGKDITGQGFLQKGTSNTIAWNWHFYSPRQALSYAESFSIRVHCIFVGTTLPSGKASQKVKWSSFFFFHWREQGRRSNGIRPAG